MPQTINNMVQEWVNSLTTYTAIKMNIPTDVSAAGSLLMDLQVGGSSRFNITKAGVVNLTGTQQVGFGSTSNTLDFYAQNTQFVRLTQTEFRLSTGSLAFGPSVTGSDLYLTRRATANLRLGAADAAAPVAQTLSVQSVVAGTTNTAGAALTITGSQGTGTGAGGSIVFQVAPAGGAGTAQNALVNALTINGAGDGITVISPSNANSTRISIQQSNGTTRFVLGVANSSGSILNGSITGDPCIRSDTARFLFGDTGGSLQLGLISTSVIIPSTSSLAWTNVAASASSFGNLDVQLFRDAANTLALRNGANAQTFRVYNTTDGTNSEFGKIAWSSNVLQIGTDVAGTGTIRGVDITIGSAATYTVRTNQLSGPAFNGTNYVLTSGYVQMNETTAPVAAANAVRLYTEDNGSGKTRLMALFPTGAAVQIAIEP